MSIKKLTNREIVLINLLIILVVVYFGVIKLLMPLYSKLDSNEINLEQMKIDDASTRAQIASKSLVEKALADNTDEYNALRNRLSPFLNNDTIVQNLTLLCSKNNLKATMSMINPTILENEVQAALDAGASLPENISINYLELKAYGEIANISRLINDINVIDYINIRSAQIINDEELYSVNLELGIYTCLD